MKSRAGTQSSNSPLCGLRRVNLHKSHTTESEHDLFLIGIRFSFYKVSFITVKRRRSLQTNAFWHRTEPCTSSSAEVPCGFPQMGVVCSSVGNNRLPLPEFSWRRTDLASWWRHRPQTDRRQVMTAGSSSQVCTMYSNVLTCHPPRNPRKDGRTWLFGRNQL